MVNVLLLLIRHDLCAFVRSKSALFWALGFPVLLLTVMLLAFGQANSLGRVNIERPALDPHTPAARCLAAIEQSFASGSPVQGQFSSLGPPDSVPDNTVRVLPGAAEHAWQIQYDFHGAVAVRAGARLIEMALLRCSAAPPGNGANARIRLQDYPSKTPPLDAGLFFTSGILVIVLMSQGILSTALSIAALREHNALKVYACFPVPKLIFLASIVLSRILLMALSSTALLLVARFAYGIEVPLWSLQTLHALPVLLLGGTMLLSLGLLLASRTDSVKQTELLCQLVHYPALFFGNLTLALDAAPDWLQRLLGAVPINQFVGTLRQVWLEGAPLSSAGLAMLSLAGWTLLFFTAASVTFRWHKP